MCDIIMQALGLYSRAMQSSDGVWTLQLWPVDSGAIYEGYGGRYGIQMAIWVLT